MERLSTETGTVSKAVEFRARNKHRGMLLAGGVVHGHGHKALKEQRKRRAEMQKSPHLVSPDISVGQESPWLVCCFNSESAEKLPAEFEYITRSEPVGKALTADVIREYEVEADALQEMNQLATAVEKEEREQQKEARKNKKLLANKAQAAAGELASLPGTGTELPEQDTCASVLQPEEHASAASAERIKRPAAADELQSGSKKPKTDEAAIDGASETSVGAMEAGADNDTPADTMEQCGLCTLDEPAQTTTAAAAAAGKSGVHQADSACIQLNKNPRSGEPWFPYNHDRCLIEVCDFIRECGTECKLGRKCLLKLVQHGLPRDLEVFKTPNRGWGVRCWHKILAGDFISEYIGEILTSDDADLRDNDECFFDLQVVPFDSRGAAGAISQDSSEYLIDGRTRGNLTRFINHSCSPNLMVQCVFVGKQNLPRICLFAAQDIEPGTELLYDYAQEHSGATAFQCSCGAENCKSVQQSEVQEAALATQSPTECD